MEMANLDNLFQNAFTHGQTLEINGERMQFSVSRGGFLEVPSGRITACDPFVNSLGKPFVQGVLPGRYPVDFSIVQQADSHVERIAFARISFTKRAPAVWVTALICDGSKLDQSGIGATGFRSRSGTASFMDAAARKALKFDSIAEVDAVLELLGPNFKPTRSWLDFAVDEKCNAIIFSSGFGPGHYPSYFAIDEEGDVAALVTSFLNV